MDDHTDNISRIDDAFKAEIMTTAPTSQRAMNWPQLIEDAKVMARCRLALPPHLRNNPSDCWAILQATLQWGLSNPFFVAQNSYVVSNRQGVETLAYTSAVYQAVLATSGAIIGVPQYTYAGEGPTRTCTAAVLDKQTRQWENATTPPLAKCRKNSPLWNDDPDQQLAYFAVRRLVRQKYAHVFGGLYDRDEMDDIPAPVEASPNLLERLPGRMEGEGFQPEPEELRRQEEEAVKAVKAKVAEKKKGGWPKGLTKAQHAEKKAAEERAREAAQKAREAAASPEAIPGPAVPDEVPEPSPEAEEGLPFEEGPVAESVPIYRGPPRNALEYHQYFYRMLEGLDVANLQRWYDSEREKAFREKFGIVGTRERMYATLIRERVSKT